MLSRILAGSAALCQTMLRPDTSHLMAEFSRLSGWMLTPFYALQETLNGETQLRRLVARPAARSLAMELATVTEALHSHACAYGMSRA